MSEPRRSIIVKLQSPFLQALIVLALMLLFDLSGKFLQMAGMDIGPRYPWNVSASFLLFFALLNSLLSLLAKSTDHYWGKSILSYIALAALGGVAAKMFSSLNINEAGSYRWLYIVLTIGYLVFLSIIGLVRKIVEFAQKEEWEKPRQRNKKR
jgi:FtsH-binding integral membrane protein